MRILVVEDDFVARKFLSKVLSGYGEVDIAIDGSEGVNAFRNAINEGKRYELICLDIMMPEMDGQEVLKMIRNIEYENDIMGLKGAKIIMTTALKDVDNIAKAFREQAEAYLVKPISIEEINKTLKNLGMA